MKLHMAKILENRPCLPLPSFCCRGKMQFPEKTALQPRFSICSLSLSHFAPLCKLEVTDRYANYVLCKGALTDTFPPPKNKRFASIYNSVPLPPGIVLFCLFEPVITSVWVSGWLISKIKSSTCVLCFLFFKSGWESCFSFFFWQSSSPSLALTESAGTGYFIPGWFCRASVQRKSAFNLSSNFLGEKRMFGWQVASSHPSYRYAPGWVRPQRASVLARPSLTGRSWGRRP